MTLVEQIAELAETIEINDPIDWGMLAVSEKEIYNLISSSVLDNYLSSDAEDRDMMMLATTVKLIVENFVLNLKSLKNS